MVLKLALHDGDHQTVLSEYGRNAYAITRVYFAYVVVSSELFQKGVRIYYRAIRYERGKRG